jgi:DNA-binding GntR family transcriptional regulator
MRRLIALCAALMLTAPVLAQAQDRATEEQLAAFRAALERLGCVVDSDDRANQIHLETGFDEALLTQIVGQLMARGEVVLMSSDEGGIRLTSGRCQ